MMILGVVVERKLIKKFKGFKLKALLSFFKHQNLKPGAFNPGSSLRLRPTQEHKPPEGDEAAEPDARAPQPTTYRATQVNHNTIVYQYRPCTQRHCVVVPAHCTHSVI